MALSDLAIYSEYAYDAMIEVLDQNTARFNEASQGTLILASGTETQGDYNEAAQFKLLSGVVRDRDPGDNTTDIAAVKLEHVKHRDIKVGAGTFPVDLSKAQFDWISIDPKTAGAAAGQAIASDLLQRYLNTAIGVAKNAIAANAIATGAAGGLVFDGSAGTQVPVNFVKTAKLFGDRAGDIRAWVTHSNPMHDMWAGNMTNSEKLFVYGNVIIQRDPFGRLFIITDSPDLYLDATTDLYYTLGLTEGAVTISQNNDFRTATVDTLGKNNIQTRMQSEWSYQVALKGYTWDLANGGTAPTLAEVKTGSNWDQWVTSHKDTAGVMMKTQ